MKVTKFLRRIMVMALAVCVLWNGSLFVDAATLKDVFDEQYYADNNPDLKEAFGYDREALWKHYTTYGMKEERSMSSLIDLVAYRKQYADLDAAFGDNWNAYLNHYLTYGAKEGRNTSTDFNAFDYAERYGDLKEAFGSNVLALWKHYQTSGKAEGRDGRDEDVIEAERAAEDDDDDSSDNSSQGNGSSNVGESHTHTPVPDTSQNKDATCAAEGWKDATKCSGCGVALNAGTKVEKTTTHDYGDDDKCKLCGADKPTE